MDFPVVMDQKWTDTGDVLLIRYNNFLDILHYHDEANSNIRGFH